MAAYISQKPFRSAAPEHLNAIGVALTRLGYELKRANSNSLELKFRGSTWVVDDSKSAHKLSVSVTADGFTFEISYWGATFFTKAEKASFEARFLQAMSVLGTAQTSHVTVQNIYQPPASRESSHHHTIERQVVVTRCKFCSKLTPVDLEECDHCGANKFC